MTSRAVPSRAGRMAACTSSMTADMPTAAGTMSQRTRGRASAPKRPIGTNISTFAPNSTLPKVTQRGSPWACARARKAIRSRCPLASGGPGVKVMIAMAVRKATSSPADTHCSQRGVGVEDRGAGIGPW